LPIADFVSLKKHTPFSRASKNNWRLAIGNIGGINTIKEDHYA
jgi:hypothetical protein